MASKISKAGAIGLVPVVALLLAVPSGLTSLLLGTVVALGIAGGILR